MATPVPINNERARVAALQKYAILDTEPEQAFEDLVLLASFVFSTPIAMISLVDEDRQWFKSKMGMSISETPREIAFCATAIRQPDVFVVPDTLNDERFQNNPLVTSYDAYPHFKAIHEGRSDHGKGATQLARCTAMILELSLVGFLSPLARKFDIYP